jgi:hypothetical protein
MPLSAIIPIVSLSLTTLSASFLSHSGIGPTMTTSFDEKISNKERDDIWLELQLFRHDTLALRTEAHRLRTAGRLDATANERLRTEQKVIERRGEAIIKRRVHSCFLIFWPRLTEHRLSPEVEWPVGRESGTWKLAFLF